MLKLWKQTEEFHNGSNNKKVTAVNGTVNNTTGEDPTLNYDFNIL